MRKDICPICKGLKDFRAKHCYDCYQKFFINEQFTEEARSKMAIASKRTLNGFKRGHKTWLGKNHSKESKIKIGKNHNPNSNPRGEKSHFWRGGITSLNFRIRGLALSKEWRKAIFKRDNWTCQECGKTNCKLNADHEKPFSLILFENEIDSLEKAMDCKELWDIKNGRTLCKGCHKLTNTYGEKAKGFIPKVVSIKNVLETI